MEDSGRKLENYKFIESDYCRACGKNLVDSDSQLIGIGPECIKQLGIDRKKTIQSINEGNGFLFFEGTESIDSTLDHFMGKISARAVIDIDHVVSQKHESLADLVKTVKRARAFSDGMDPDKSSISKTRKYRLQNNIKNLAAQIRALSIQTSKLYNNTVNYSEVMADVKRLYKLEESYNAILDKLEKVPSDDGVPFEVPRNLLNNEAQRIVCSVVINLDLQGDQSRVNAATKIVTDLCSEYGYTLPLEQLTERKAALNDQKIDAARVREAAKTGDILSINMNFLNRSLLRLFINESKTNRSNFIRASVPVVSNVIKNKDMKALSDMVQCYLLTGTHLDIFDSVRGDIKSLMDEGGKEWGPVQKRLYATLKQSGIWDALFKRAS